MKSLVESILDAEEHIGNADKAGKQFIELCDLAVRYIAWCEVMRDLWTEVCKQHKKALNDDALNTWLDAISKFHKDVAAGIYYDYSEGSITIAPTNDHQYERFIKNHTDNLCKNWKNKTSHYFSERSSGSGFEFIFDSDIRYNVRDWLEINYPEYVSKLNSIKKEIRNIIP